MGSEGVRSWGRIHSTKRKKGGLSERIQGEQSPLMCSNCEGEYEKMLMKMLLLLLMMMM